MDKHKILDLKDFKRIDKQPEDLLNELDKLSVEGWNTLFTIDERFVILSKEIKVESEVNAFGLPIQQPVVI